jgi:hypothetical protein
VNNLKIMGLSVSSLRSFGTWVRLSVGAVPEPLFSLFERANNSAKDFYNIKASPSAFLTLFQPQPLFILAPIRSHRAGRGG